MFGVNQNGGININNKGDGNKIEIYQQVDQGAYLQKLMKEGKTGEVAAYIDRIKKQVGTMGPGFPYWITRVTEDEKGRTVISHSPINEQAAKDYPGTGNAILIIPDEYKEIGSMDDLLQYSYTKQKPLEFDAEMVRLMIGDELLNEWTREKSGEIKITFIPHKFPEPQPMRLQTIDGSFSLDFLFGLSEIDGSNLLFNNEKDETSKLSISYTLDTTDIQKNSNFNVCIKEEHITDVEAGYQYLRFLQEMRESMFTFSLVGNDSKVFLGKMWTPDCEMPDLDEQVTLLKRIFKIENSFLKSLSLPDKISEDDMSAIGILEAAIDQKVIEHFICELNIEIYKDGVEYILSIEKEDEIGLSITFKKNEEVMLFGERYQYKGEYTYESLKLSNREKLEAKYSLMEDEESVRVKLLPISNEKNRVKCRYYPVISQIGNESE